MSLQFITNDNDIDKIVKRRPLIAQRKVSIFASDWAGVLSTYAIFHNSENITDNRIIF